MSNSNTLKGAWKNAMRATSAVFGALAQAAEAAENGAESLNELAIMGKKQAKLARAKAENKQKTKKAKIIAKRKKIEAKLKAEAEAAKAKKKEVNEEPKSSIDL